MNEAVRTKEQPLRRWFRLCPARHVLSLLGLALIGAYFALRSRAGLMQILSDRLVRPWHRAVGRLCARLPFSAAEALIALGVLAALIYILCSVVRLLRGPARLLRFYRFFMTCLTAFSLIYGGFCLLWGVYYYSADFETQSGVTAAPVRTEQLETVTRWFTDLLNDYDARLRRGPDSAFSCDMDEIFARSANLYDAAAAEFPCLAGDGIAAKPFFFSRAMSYTNFTGFFFPFTGESNINVDAPACLVPSTIAHELAHQRGVAAEDEANFVAVLASLDSGDPVYGYSACLLAYIHLGNALYTADRDAWAENYRRLGPGPRADLAENSTYWAQFETPVATVSDSIYTGFLQSYGQTEGLRTYGKCVDLLIAYYYNLAREAIDS